MLVTPKVGARVRIVADLDNPGARPRFRRGLVVESGKVDDMVIVRHRDGSEQVYGLDELAGPRWFIAPGT